MILIPVVCLSCLSCDIVRHGTSAEGKQRCLCHNEECSRKTFLLNYSYRDCLSEIKQQIIEMALNGSGIRDTARVLKISTDTVLEELKKRSPASNRSITIY